MRLQLTTLAVYGALFLYLRVRAGKERARASHAEGERLAGPARARARVSGGGRAAHVLSGMFDVSQYGSASRNFSSGFRAFLIMRATLRLIITGPIEMPERAVGL